jgi:hypothetical protein
MANVLEVLFFNSFLEVALGFSLLPVGEISPKKKTLLCNVTVSTRTAKSSPHGLQ